MVNTDSRETVGAALNVCLVGAGRWGKRIITTIDAIPDINLAAVASRSGDTESLVSSGCRVVADWQDAISIDNLDGVIVASPPHSHFAIAHAVLAQELPVMIEKPLTLDTAQSEALRVASSKTGLPTLVDHTHLFAPAYAAIKKDMGYTSRINKIIARAGNAGPVRTDTPTLWDWAPHDIAMCLDLAKTDPCRIDATVLERRPELHGSGEKIGISLTFDGGIEATIEVSNIDRHKSRYLEVVDGDGQSWIYDDLAQQKAVRRTPKGADIALPIIHDRPLTRAVRAFANAIRGRCRHVSDIAFGHRVVSVLAACDVMLGSGPGKA